MDLHDYNDVASNYDKYINELVGMSGFDNHTCIEFHLELAKEYGSDGIIDIACGTGLIMLPLLKEGYNVTGIDISEEMINQTSMKIENEGIDKNYNLICSNMAEFQLKELASLAIIPRSGFLHLIRQDDQISALKSINKNLVMDGILSLNTFFPSYDIISLRGKGKDVDRFYRTSFTNDDGNKEKIYNITEYNHATQVIEGSWIFETIDNDGNVLEKRERPVRMRWIFETEMTLLFNLCGFEVIKRYGGYDKSKAIYPGNIIWIAKKIREVNN